MDESCSLIVERDSTLRKVWVDFMNELLTMAVPSLRCDPGDIDPAASCSDVGDNRQIRGPRHFAVLIHRHQNPNVAARAAIKACHQNKRGRAAFIERK
jgi:hypothetical protein